MEQTSNFSFDLRSLRELKLKLTQKELGDAMNCGQDYISRLEQHPESMQLDFFYQLCSTFRLHPNDVLQFQLRRPVPLKATNIYANTRAKLAKLQNEMEKIKSSPAGITPILPIIQEFQQLKDRLLDKPLVALLGPSDAGKSTLINALTGLDVLEEKWTPTTSATVHLRHISDKPSWMGDHNVAIFRAESSTQSWNVKNIHEASYCNEHLLHLGGYDLLGKYCNRHENRTYEEVDSAILYTDSELLHACDFVDLPGFGTENEADTIKSQRTKAIADVVLFLTPALGFLNRHEDMLLLKEIIRTMPGTHTKESPLLSSLFILATHARTAKTVESANEILSTRADSLLNVLSDELIEAQFGMTKRMFGTTLKKRFFTYELDEPVLRERFEKEFLKLVTKQLPALKRKQTREAVASFKKRVLSSYDVEIQKVEGILKGREQAKADHAKAKRVKEARFREIDDLEHSLRDRILASEKKDVESMVTWEEKTITSDFVLDLIRRKGYDRKQAKAYILSDLSDLYFAQMQTVLKSSLGKVETDLSKFFAEVEQKIDDIGKHTAGSAGIPFDFKGALSGGVAGATVLGGLGLWAGTVGNLGGYILVAKGVGLLSTLGISVGGGAAATTFVAAIGGPVTIGIALAIGAFGIVSAIFGDGWKKRMSKDAVKTLRSQNVLTHYTSRISNFWQETLQGVGEVVNSIKNEYSQSLSSIEPILQSDDAETAQLRLTELKHLKSSFESLPWEDDEEDKDE